MKVQKAEEEDLCRAEELTIRTHQLNSTGYTYSYDELKDFCTNDAYDLLVVDLNDKYGYYGKIGLVLANGALSTHSSGEGEIRKKIIEDDLIEGIVTLPTQLFYSVSIPVTLWFISRNKKQKGKTLFIDARALGHMVDKTHRDFSDEDIRLIADAFTAFQNGTFEEQKGFSAIATLQDIADHDYILTPGRYVGMEDIDDDDEPFGDKMTRLMANLINMFDRSHTLERDILEKLEAIGYEE